jgi:hypothetical protein
MVSSRWIRGRGSPKACRSVQQPAEARVQQRPHIAGTRGRLLRHTATSPGPANSTSRASRHAEAIHMDRTMLGQHPASGIHPTLGFRPHTSLMSPGRVAACMTLALALAASSNIAVGAAPHNQPTAWFAQGRPSASSSSHSVSPSRSLHRVARRHHATFTAGPVRRDGHLFGAYSIVGSVYCCRAPHDKLRLLRWRNGRWVRYGLLRAVKQNVGRAHEWDFPDYTLDSKRIRIASRKAPVFGGPVNGAYPTAHMLAVRTGGWHWAHFIECRHLAGCTHPKSRSITVLNPRVSHGRLTSRVSSCTPSCSAPHQVLRVIRFAWRPTRRAFVEVSVHRTRT